MCSFSTQDLVGRWWALRAATFLMYWASRCIMGSTFHRAPTSQTRSLTQPNPGTCPKPRWWRWDQRPVSSLLASPASFAVPPLSLPWLRAGPRAVSTVMVGSLGFLLKQDSACGGWTFLRERSGSCFAARRQPTLGRFSAPVSLEGSSSPWLPPPLSQPPHAPGSREIPRRYRGQPTGCSP